MGPPKCGVFALCPSNGGAKSPKTVTISKQLDTTSVPHPRREKLFALAIVALRLINEAETTRSPSRCTAASRHMISILFSLLDKQTRFFRHFSRVDSSARLMSQK